MLFLFHRVIGQTSSLLLALLGGCGEASQRPASCSSDAAALRVITSGGYAAAFDMLAPEFEARTGTEILTSYGSSSGGAPDSIPQRLARAEAFDVIIMARPALDKLLQLRLLVSESTTDLAESRIGMAVKAGAEVPDISSVETFELTLRRAKSIGYSASASGTYLSSQLWPAMGIWEELRHKSLRIEGERVASVVARGDVEIGFQQISEILPIAGIEFVGPIPESLQLTTVFSATVPAESRRRETARCLIAFLSSSDVADIVRSTGMSPIGNAGLSALQTINPSSLRCPRHCPASEDRRSLCR